MLSPQHAIAFFNLFITTFFLITVLTGEAINRVNTVHTMDISIITISIRLFGRISFVSLSNYILLYVYTIHLYNICLSVSTGGFVRVLVAVF